MVCSSTPDHDLDVAWRDFPKGLRVLLLDEDVISAAETKLKLEAMDYIVFSYDNEEEAREAIYNKVESFHVAIVEVTSLDSHGSFRFLEITKDLPTIAISDVHCLSTMMKCIALGAAEFLQKPLSEEKLRNIWQHVVHKAFNTGGNGLSKSLQPIKETVVSMLQLQSHTTEPRIDLSNTKTMDKDYEDSKHDDDSGENDRFPAPSTPQLVKGGRSMDEGYSQDPQNCSKDKDLLDNANYSNSKFVDNSTYNLLIAVNGRSKDVLNSNQTKDTVQEETSDNGSKTDECSSIKDGCQPSLNVHNVDHVESSAEDQKKRKLFNCSNKNSRRKMKVDWTPDLHRKFLQAVEQLGIDQAIPSKILELMKVEGLTRHNIASHLQKYRVSRRHILPNDDNRRWKQHKDSFPSVYVQKPVTVLRPRSQIYPLWGHPSYYTPGAQMCIPTWHPHQGSWPWKTTHTGIHAEAWGCPVVPPYSRFAIPSQNTILNNGLDANGGRNKLSKDSYDFNLAEEVIDGVVKEAISKPWLPLPLGLKPPSIDNVLTELQHQGICSIPRTTRRC